MMRLLTLLAIIGWLVGSMISGAFAVEVYPMELYVATTGKDSADGSKTKPFATLEGARNAIRVMKKAKKKIPPEGITVWIRGGEYTLASSFALTAEDSGTATGRIIYRAIKGERVRLIGGRHIPAFTPVTDPLILSRLDPAVRGKVMQADLHALGITDLGTMKSRGFGRPTRPSHPELFYDGKVMTLARWPNDGFVTIAGIPEGAGENDGHGQALGKLTAGFLYTGDWPKRWQQMNDIWVHGYWAWDWSNTYEQINTIDTEKRLITTRDPYGMYGFRPGQRFYFLNILEEIDEPGEYYLDHTTGILYFWPPAEGKEAFISLIEQPLVSMQECSNVTLQGLIFEYSRGSGIFIKGGTDNHIRGCVIRNLGNYGVSIEGDSGHAVTGCDIYAVGDGGISLTGGDRKTLTPGKLTAENNHIHHIGLWSRCYQPGVMVNGVGNRVAHNLIHDGPHNAIQLSGNEHVIEYNDIHHVCLETGDVGAFYMGRDWTMRGNIVRYNYFHETGGVGMGSMAVYLDDCASGTTIFGNIFYRTQRAAFIGGGRDNMVVNNIFVECTPAVCLDGRGLDASPVWHDMVYKTMRERLQAVNYRQAPYRDAYPKLADLDQYYAGTGGIPPEGNVIAHNISVGGKWLEIGWHATPAMVTLQDNLVDKDPLFVNMQAHDFRLQANSPAFALGFKPIPVDTIGLVEDEDRASLPKE